MTADLQKNEPGILVRQRPPWSLSSSLFAGLLLIYACFVQNRDWNTASRMLLTCAIVQNQAMEITDFVAVNGELIRHPQTRDVAEPRKGHFFCDKAPGHSFLGVVPYWLAIRFSLAKPIAPAMPAVKNWPADYWVTLGTNGMVTAATAVLLLHFLSHLGVRLVPATSAALAYGLATNALPYATLYYGHSTAGFLCLSCIVLWQGRRESFWRGFVAGAVAGYAVIVEYPMVVLPFAVIVVSIGAAIFDDRFRWRPLWGFLVGGLPMAVGLAWCNYLVTGSPFRFPYMDEVLPMFKRVHETAIPIGWPNPDVIVKLLFGQQRGLLWYCPVVLGALPGFWLLVRRREKMLATVCLLTFAGLFWINAGFPMWYGGWSTGPRFLLPAVPLLMLATGVWLGSTDDRVWVLWPNRALKFVWSIVAVASGAVLVGYTVTGAQVPQELERPLSQFLATALKYGMAQPHLGQWVVKTLGLGGKTAYPGFIVMIAVCTVTALTLLGLALRQQRRESDVRQP